MWGRAAPLGGTRHCTPSSPRARVQSRLRRHRRKRHSSLDARAYCPTLFSARAHGACGRAVYQWVGGKDAKQSGSGGRGEISVSKAVYPVQIAAAVRMRLDAQIAALCQGLHTTVDLAEGKRTGAGKRSLPQIAYARLRADFTQREQHALLVRLQLRLVRRLYIGSAHATLLRRGLACT